SRNDVQGNLGPRRLNLEPFKMRVDGGWLVLRVRKYRVVDARKLPANAHQEQRRALHASAKAEDAERCHAHLFASPASRPAEGREARTNSNRLKNRSFGQYI